VVWWIYRRARKSTEVAASFPVTLVLLSVLIAMVTQVIDSRCNGMKRQKAWQRAVCKKAR